MCSRCRSDDPGRPSTRGSGAKIAIRAALAHCAVGALLLQTACDRELREFQAAPPASNPPAAVGTSERQPGEPAPEAVPASAYQQNRWAVAEGKRLFAWYNCAGCHAPGGGGAMGPPLTDTEWIYGSEPADVFASIVEGRANGMPSFRGRLSNEDTWKLVAWVRTLGRLTPRDVWPARGDELAEAQRDGPRGDSDAAPAAPGQRR